MEKSCIICLRNVANDSDDNVRLHWIPIEPNIRRVWHEKIIKLSPNSNITKSSKVCSLHFKRNDFLGWYLKAGAVPQANDSLNVSPLPNNFYKKRKITGPSESSDRVCSAPGCTNKESYVIKHSIGMHQFPKSPVARRKQWLNFVGNAFYFDPQFEFLCGAHFKKEDKLKTKLKRDANPTILTPPPIEESIVKMESDDIPTFKEVQVDCLLPTQIKSEQPEDPEDLAAPHNLSDEKSSVTEPTIVASFKITHLPEPVHKIVLLQKPIKSACTTNSEDEIKILRSQNIRLLKQNQLLAKKLQREREEVSKLRSTNRNFQNYIKNIERRYYSNRRANNVLLTNIPKKAKDDSEIMIIGI